MSSRGGLGGKATTIFNHSCHFLTPVDRIPLEACNLYGIVMDPLNMLLDCDMTLPKWVSEKCRCHVTIPTVLTQEAILEEGGSKKGVKMLFIRDHP